MGELYCIMNYLDSYRELSEVMHTKRTLYYNQGDLLNQNQFKSEAPYQCRRRHNCHVPQTTAYEIFECNQRQHNRSSRNDVVK